MSKLLDFQKNNLFTFHCKAVEVLLYIFSFTLPFSIKVSNIILVALSALLIFRKKYISDLKESLDNKILLLFSSLFLMYLLSWLWSQNERIAGFILEKHLSLILIPLILIPYKNKIQSAQIQKVLTFFVAGLLTAMLWITLNFLLEYFNSSGSMDVFYFFREEAVDFVQLHPTYLAMYLVFAISILITAISRARGKVIALYIVLVLVMLAFILLSGARMPLISLAAVIVYFLFKWFYTGRIKVKYLATGLVGLSILLLGAIQTPIVQKRIDEIKYTRFEPPTGIHFNSVNLRVAQFLCSKEILSKNWLSGVGLGDVQDVLNECYRSHDWSPALYERNYNAHSQYFQTFLTAGILGIILLISIFISLFFYFLKNTILIALIINFSICCLTESMLEKNKGLVFFVFFAIILSLENYKKSKKATSEI